MNYICNLGSVLQHKQTKRLVLVVNNANLNNTLTVKNIKDGVVWSLRPKYLDQYKEIEIPKEMLPKHYDIENFIIFNRLGFNEGSQIRMEFKMFMETLKDLENNVEPVILTQAAEGLKLGDMNIEFGKKEEE